MGYNLHNEFSGVRIMRDSAIKAVYDSDLSELLQSLRVYEEVVAGKCECEFCHEVITLENLNAIIPRENSIVFSCNSSICQTRLVIATGADRNDCERN